MVIKQNLCVFLHFIHTNEFHKPSTDISLNTICYLAHILPKIKRYRTSRVKQSTIFAILKHNVIFHQLKINRLHTDSQAR